MRFSLRKLLKLLMICFVTITMVATLISEAHAKGRHYRYHMSRRARIHNRYRNHRRVKRMRHHRYRRHHGRANAYRVSPHVEYHEPDDTMDNVTQMEYETIKMINVDRAAHNLPPLERTKAMTQLARKRADQLVELNYLTHKDPQGRYYYEQDSQHMKVSLGAYSGENIAGAGLGPILMDSNPHVYHNDNGRDMADMDEDEMVYHDADSNWGHRYNTLNTHYKYVGIGAERKEGTNNYYLAENFSS